MIWRFGFSRKINDQFLPNGLHEGHEGYERWLNKNCEYDDPHCAGPLLHMLRESGIACEQKLVSDWVKENKHFFYLIELLGSNPTWLTAAFFHSHSPWSAIDNDVKELLCRGKCHLLITNFKKHSGSKKNDPSRTNVFWRLAQVLTQFAIPLKSVIFLAPYPEASVLYQQALPDQPFHKVLYINYFERVWGNLLRKYDEGGEIIDFTEIETASDKIRQHKYLCFNREPRSHRKLFLMFLKHHNLLKEGLVSFQETKDALRFDHDEMVFKNQDLLDLLKAFEKHDLPLPLIVDSPQHHFTFCTKWPFLASYFSLLTERIFATESHWTLLTGKTFKTITQFHPFLLIGTKGYLAELRQHGYHTFSPFINESYDTIDNPDERMLAVMAETLRLVSLPHAVLHKGYYSILPILQANRALLEKRITEPLPDIYSFSEK